MPLFLQENNSFNINHFFLLIDMHFNTGNIIHKFKTPKPQKGIKLCVIIDFTFIVLYGWYLTNFYILQYMHPQVIFIYIQLILISSLAGSVILFFSFYIINAFISHLKCYEKGVFIRESYYIFLSLKKYFIRYEDIVRIKIDTDKFFNDTKALYIYVKNKEKPFKLNEYDISDINLAKKLISDVCNKN